jgi:hypothetical protein
MAELMPAVEKLLRGRCEQAMRAGIDFFYENRVFTPRSLPLAITDAVLVLAGSVGVMAGTYASSPVVGVMSEDNANPLQVFPLTATWQNPSVTLEQFMPLVDVTFEHFVLPNANDLTAFFQLAEKTSTPEYQANNRLFAEIKTAEAVAVLVSQQNTVTDTHDMTTGEISP